MANGAPNGRRARRARGSARGAVDLSAAAFTDAQAAEAQEVLELQQGARCGGCGRRIGVGFRFRSIDPRDGEKPIMMLCACARDDCDFAERCKQGATFMELVEFVWLDENGVDAAPARVVAKAAAKPG